MSSLIDISLPLRIDMPQWPGDERLSRRALSQTPDDAANVELWTLTSHTGTHVDPPRHFIHGGTTVDEVPLDRWIGPCWVADVTTAGPEVTAADLAAADVPERFTRLLLQTSNSKLWHSRPDEFVDTFVGLSVDGAEWLVERGMQLVGIDYLSIGPFHTTIVETHLTLLGNDVIVVEGLDLNGVSPGEYELLCMPLKLQGGDGAPARVALRTLD